MLYEVITGTCDTTECKSVEVVVSPGAPSQPTEIFGDTPVCPNDTVEYNINSVADATSYSWSIPGGWSTITQNDTIITVLTGSTGQNGNIRVV